MTRKCSHCGYNGHNSRTCPDRGVKLFGVRLTTEGMRKSASMGNLTHYTNPEPSDSGIGTEGYVSDGLVQTCHNARERKKGVPWTEEEHRCFLLGLQKLGKGDWRGISKNFVTSRTPTQVASHAQKYFIRQSNMSKRKRRSSLFDIPPEVDAGGYEQYPKSLDLHQLTLSHQSTSTTNPNETLPLQAFGMVLDSVKEDDQTMDTAQAAKELEGDKMDVSMTTTAAVTVDAPAFVHQQCPMIPVTMAASPVWLGLSPCFESHRVPAAPSSNLVRPTASVPRAPIRLDNSSDHLPQLHLGLAIEPSQLKLEEPSRRHSAFHTGSYSSNFKRDGKGLNVPISVV